MTSLDDKVAIVTGASRPRGIGSATALALGRWAEPEEFAGAVVWLAGPEASYLSGVALPVAGGMSPGL